VSSSNRAKVTRTDDRWFYNQKELGVGYGKKDSTCDTSAFFCAGGKTFGSGLEQAKAVKAAIDNEGIHPQAPTPSQTATKTKPQENSVTASQPEAPTESPTTPPAEDASDGEATTQLAAASCPVFNGKGTTKLLFNHISKTGGTAMRHVLPLVVPRGDIVFQEDIEKDAHLTPTDKDNFFVIGVVRRPCDYLVSWYYQALRHHEKIGEFKSFVNKQVADSTSKLMSNALSERYVSGDNVHCMMHTHTLTKGIVECMNKFQACGGTILGSDETGFNMTSVVQGALDEAVDLAHRKGRSVHDHPACTELFDAEMESKVLATEQPLIEKYGLETCCSSSAAA
jgi:hypothetical protein